MSSIAKAAIDGFNETLGGIRKAQKEFSETQEHFVSLLVFCSCEKRFIYENVPVNEVKDISRKDYIPCCGTPLYDAMGMTLNKMRSFVNGDINSNVIVTVITDGMENSSKEFKRSQIKALVEELKNEGWTFAYMGTNHDVRSVSENLSITNVHEFEDTVEGLGAGWGHLGESSRNMFCAMNASFANEMCMEEEERLTLKRMRADNFFTERKDENESEKKDKEEKKEKVDKKDKEDKEDKEEGIIKSILKQIF